MRVGIHQPHYLPWLRYFEKIARCDVFIVLDNIQYSKNGWQNRNKVKTADGATLLTVPVHDALGESLDSVRIDDSQPWRKKHWRTIQQAYAKAPYLSMYTDSLSSVYERPWEYLNELNRHMLELFVKAIGIDTRIVHASELNVPGVATERLINLIRTVGGNRYYSGAYALDAYLDADSLERAGIALDLQQWTAPVYPQGHGTFIPDLSIVDLLLNCGPGSRNILLGERP